MRYVPETTSYFRLPGTWLAEHSLRFPSDGLPWCFRGSSSLRRRERQLTKAAKGPSTRPSPVKRITSSDDELPGLAGACLLPASVAILSVPCRRDGPGAHDRPHGVWTPETARQEAKVQFGRVARGDNHRKNASSTTRRSPSRNFAPHVADMMRAHSSERAGDRRSLQRSSRTPPYRSEIYHL